MQCVRYGGRGESTKCKPPFPMNSRKPLKNGGSSCSRVRGYPCALGCRPGRRSLTTSAKSWLLSSRSADARHQRSNTGGVLLHQAGQHRSAAQLDGPQLESIGGECSNLQDTRFNRGSRFRTDEPAQALTDFLERLRLAATSG